jgi:uncharacterized protein
MGPEELPGSHVGTSSSALRFAYVRNLDRLRPFQGYSHGSLISSRHPLLPPPLTTSHLILSYPLSPRGALTLFRSSTYQAALTSLAHTPSANILVIHGTQDDFTAERKYDQWAQDLKAGAQAKFEVIKVEGATHFWHGEARTRMHDAVFAWLDNSSGRSS